MPVLLLAQGDAAARDKLRRAIEARYGPRPPAIESLQIDFRGRARVKLGPISTWVPVEATAYFLFPTAMRWDFTVKPVGVEIQRGVEAFDGQRYHRMRGSSVLTTDDDALRAQSLQSRLWAVAAVLLTPLGEQFVRLAVSDENSLNATNTQIDTTVALALRDNHTLEAVAMSCLNPDTDRRQCFTLRLSDDQAPINELMLPSKVSAFWDDEPYFEVQPIHAENNPTLAENVFTLQ